MEIPITKVTVKIDGIEDAVNKVNELIDKLKEAQALADEISGKVSCLNFEFLFNDQPADSES